MPSATSIVVVLGTGGTIAGVADDAGDDLGYRAATLPVAALLAAAPGSGEAARARAIEAEQVAQLDSKDMDRGTWLRLLARVDHHLGRTGVAGVVVTHGTDTLEETAYFLARTTASTKPVVLTAAMRPATSRDADGPRNLADALCVAATLPDAGVVCVIDGAVHAAGDVRKRHPQRLDAFSSGDAGPIAVVEGDGGDRRVRRLRESAPLECVDMGAAMLTSVAWPWVEIVTSTAAAEPRAVQALVAAGVDGIVVATTGNGTVHGALEAALRDAVARGVAVLRSTRCLDGGIVERQGVADVAETAQAADAADAADAALPSAGALTPVQARVELLLRLTARRQAGHASAQRSG